MYSPRGTIFGIQIFMTQHKRRRFPTQRATFSFCDSRKLGRTKREIFFVSKLFWIKFNRKRVFSRHLMRFVCSRILFIKNNVTLYTQKLFCVMNFFKNSSPSLSRYCSEYWPFFHFFLHVIFCLFEECNFRVFLFHFLILRRRFIVPKIDKDHFYWLF